MENQESEESAPVRSSTPATFKALRMKLILRQSSTRQEFGIGGMGVPVIRAVVLALCVVLTLIVPASNVPTAARQASEPWAAPTAKRPFTPFEETLGQPISAVSTPMAAFTTTDDGTPIAVAVVEGSPARLTAVHAATGSVVYSANITEQDEPNVAGWAITTSKTTGKVFVGGSLGTVYVFDPNTLTFRPVAQQYSIRDLFYVRAAPADNGDIIFTTYPDGKVLRFRPSTNTWRDYGTLGHGNAYTMGVDVRDESVYVGTGTGDPGLWRIDMVTGRKSRVLLPETIRENPEVDFVQDVTATRRFLYIRIAGLDLVLVYDRIKSQWHDRIDNVAGMIAEGMHSGQSDDVFLARPGKGTIKYDPATKMEMALPQKMNPGAFRGYAWLEVTKGVETKSLVTVNSSFVLHAWTPAVGEVHVTPSAAKPAPRLIRSLAFGPNGNLNVGALGDAGYFQQINPRTLASKSIRAPRQVESFTSSGDYLIYGTYPGARIRRYDPDLVAAPGLNPSQPSKIGLQQDRPLTMVAAGAGRTAIGSMANYGVLGGALTVYNNSTGDVDVYADIVPNQTPQALVYRDGKIYGGTGVTGGLGATPRAEQGKLFVFDLSTRTVTDIIVPVPGEANVSALAFDDDGRLWGLTADSVFMVNADTFQVVTYQRYSNFQDRKPYARGRSLEVVKDQLVGSTRGRIFVIDPKTLKRELIAHGTNLAVGADRNYYYSRGSHLLRWVTKPF